MHFGKLVKKVAMSRNLSAQDLAVLMKRDPRNILLLFEHEQWLSADIIAASAALNYNFGKHLDRSDCSQVYHADSYNRKEIILRVKYEKGKDTLLLTWINKIMLIAKTIGLEVER